MPKWYRKLSKASGRILRSGVKGILGKKGGSTSSEPGTEGEEDLPEGASGLELVMAYHERTKHHPQRYAKAPGFMDWANQPDPFRRYENATNVSLSDAPPSAEIRYDGLFQPESAANNALNRATVSRLFRDALALSAWKQAPGSEPWALRVNPSSGNLHPIEGYLLAGPIEDLSREPAVFHYSVFAHALEKRVALTAGEWAELTEELPPNSLFVVLTSIHWRSSWKYGERAFRYSQLDAGHAIGSVVIAAATQGWRAQMISSVGDGDLEEVLGIGEHHEKEPERVEAMLLLSPGPMSAATRLESVELPEGMLKRLRNEEYEGTPNVLSKDHQTWEVISDVSKAVRHDGDETFEEGEDESPVSPTAIDVTSLLPERSASASAIIQQRRSAISMDGRTSIKREAFFQMLLRCVPRTDAPPFEVLTWRPRISLLLFVHRVDDLEPGIYGLVRHPSHRAALQSALDDDFLWSPPAGCPPQLPLYLLRGAECRDEVASLNCYQEIAGDGAFAVAMLAEFEPSLEAHGPAMYPRLFWEAGMVGHVIYLEAEAAEVRSTGIGCFFDDVLHKMVGLKDLSWQTIYHQTVGKHTEDPRLRTIEPYSHLRGKQSSP